MPSRRNLLTSSLALSCWPAYSQWLPPAAPPPSQNQKPIEPYIKLDAPVLEDEKKVLSFFDFKCPFCADLHKSLFQWGSSLPKRYEHRFVPVVNPSDQSSMFAAIAFYQVERQLSDHKLYVFMERAYDAYHGSSKSGYPQQDLRWWASIADVSINLKDKTLQRRIENAALALKSYEVVSTPTLAIGGRFTVTPEITQGNRAMFMQLLNAVFSMHMETRR